MTIPNWSIMLTQIMGLSWRDISSKGPVTPSKHGTGLCVQLQEYIAKMFVLCILVLKSVNHPQNTLFYSSLLHLRNIFLLCSCKNYQLGT